MDNDINALFLINQRVLNYPKVSGYREHDVFCLAKTGQTVRFANPEGIPLQVKQLMSNFSVLFKRSESKAAVASTLAYFWLGFIAIHPFTDGNGRTGKAFILKKLSEKNLFIKGLDQIDAFLLTGDLPNDLQKLKTFFKNSIYIKESA